MQQVLQLTGPFTLRFCPVRRRTLPLFFPQVTDLEDRPARRRHPRTATSIDVDGVEQSKMQYDSTGMYHWCPSRDIQDCLMDRQEAAMTVLQVGRTRKQANVFADIFYVDFTEIYLTLYYLRQWNIFKYVYIEFSYQV